ncbi:MAG: tRNA (N6-isopentenyl adenosine(37)-C2)-methylthiotransferase MiaB [Desulfovibrionaceae bacterium]
MMHDSFHIMTFGCQMNVNDSDWLARSLRQRGLQDAPLEEAGVIILNTCSVRDKPEQKVYNALARIRHATRHTPQCFVVVAGCVAQQIGTALFTRFPQVRLVVGGDGIAAAPDAILRLCAAPALTLSLVDFSQTYPERDTALTPAALGKTQMPPVAYVNIMQGCDNYCAYCIVPYTRGRQKSRSTAAVLQECRSLLGAGAKEITLLGQNVNAFGQDDQGDGTTFAALLHQVAGLEGLKRLRFVTPHPKDFSPEVVRAFGELPVLCPRVHLPLQAGSDAVLARMGRRYDSARFLALVAALRAVRPDMALSSDIIVGFPGESEDDFTQTCRMLEQVPFMASYSFCYSDRPGTKAEMLPDKIPPNVKLERLARLQAVQERLGQAWLNARVGDTTTVLIEGASRRAAPSTQGASWQGHDPYGATVHLTLPEGQGAIGQLRTGKIITAKKHSLVAQAVS